MNKTPTIDEIIAALRTWRVGFKVFPDGRYQDRKELMTLLADTLESINSRSLPMNDRAQWRPWSEASPALKVDGLLYAPKLGQACFKAIMAWDGQRALVWYSNPGAEPEAFMLFDPPSFGDSP